MTDQERQLTIFDPAGPDVQAGDKVRIRTQLSHVFGLMKDGYWRSLADIRRVVPGSEAGISARLRDLRKKQCGGHTVDRRRRSAGTWEYRLIVNKGGDCGPLQ
jgi:hypothetical protein